MLEEVSNGLVITEDYPYTDCEARWLDDDDDDDMVHKLIGSALELMEITWF